MNGSPDPVVLIHGAWHGAWVWDHFKPLLARMAGITAIAVDLPGNGSDDIAPADVSLDRYIAHISAILKGLGQPVSLVAHSGGGLIASAVAERFPESVRRIVYVAGMMLPSGMAFADLVAELRADHPDAIGIGPHLLWSDDGLTSRVPTAAALAYFFHDCADGEAAAVRLTPQPEHGRNIRVALTPERFGGVPRLYVEAEADRSIILACQRRMQALVPGAEVVTLSTGHAPHLAAPGLLATALIPFLTAAGDGMPLAGSDPGDEAQAAARQRPGSLG